MPPSLWMLLAIVNREIFSMASVPDCRIRTCLEGCVFAIDEFVNFGQRAEIAQCLHDMIHTWRNGTCWQKSFAKSCSVHPALSLPLG